MDSVDLEVLRSARDWHLAGHAVALGTVVHTWGSAPRPVGAMLAIRQDGHLVGSVSGGCVEDDLIDRVREGLLTMQVPQVFRYGVSGENAARFGLPCGGTVEVVMQRVTEDSGIAALVDAVARHEQVTRTLDMQTGAASLSAGGGSDAVQFDGRVLRTVHGPRWRLLMIGAGQVSTYLARMAQALDYEVLLCDPRDEYEQEFHIEGVRRVKGYPDDAVLDCVPDAHTAIVALTHDPKLDDAALLEALKSPAFYVGALGSRRNNDARRERLALFELSGAEIARLHGPIGLNIGSRTPPEIAISILAEMTAVRHGVAVPQVPRHASTEGCATA